MQTTTSQVRAEDYGDIFDPSPFSDVECHELLKAMKDSGFKPEPHFSHREMKAVIFYLDKLLNGK